MAESRTRMPRTMTSWAPRLPRMMRPCPRRVMPGGGALRPSMVTKGPLHVEVGAEARSPRPRRRRWSGCRGRRASRRLPVPESSRVVTRTTVPPAPPSVVAPKPWWECVWDSADSRQGCAQEQHAQGQYPREARPPATHAPSSARHPARPHHPMPQRKTQLRACERMRTRVVSHRGRARAWPAPSSCSNPVGGIGGSGGSLPPISLN